MAGRCTGFGGAGGAADGADASATGSCGVDGLFLRGFGERAGAAPGRPGGATTRAMEAERMGRVIELAEPEAGRVR